MSVSDNKQPKVSLSNPFELAQDSVFESTLMAVQRVGVKLNQQYEPYPVDDADLEQCNYKTEKFEKPYNPMDSLRQLDLNQSEALSMGTISKINKKRNKQYFDNNDAAT